MATPSPTSQQGPGQLSDAALAELLARTTGLTGWVAQDMVDAVRNRGEDSQSYFGLTPEIVASMENAGVALYQAKRYGEALDLFAGILFLTNDAHAPAWRGKAACLQMQHHYAEAATAYAEAVLRDEGDLLSGAYLGECLCLVGRQQEGLTVLRGVVAAAGAALSKAPHIVRAQAILRAGGGQARAKQPAAAAPHAALTAPAAAAAPSGDAASAERPPTAMDDDAYAQAMLEDTQRMFASLAKPAHEQQYQSAFVRDMLRDQEGRALMEKLADAVADKTVTIREIAGFTPEQMDAGYHVARLHYEQGDILQAMAVITRMLWIDSKDTRFYTLAGLCAQQMSLFCLADYCYELVRIWRPGGSDAATLIYQGEAKIRNKEVDEGLTLVRRGLEMGASEPAMGPLLQRGQALLKFGAAMQNQATPANAPVAAATHLSPPAAR